MTLSKLFKALLLVCLASSQLTQAQEVGKHAQDYTYAEGSPEYWRNTHSTRPGNFVFRRDPNIWVYTPEITKRVGMPLEWASDELKGVAAAAFRMERDGAEDDSGLWGNAEALLQARQNATYQWLKVIALDGDGVISKVTPTFNAQGQRNTDSRCMAADGRGASLLASAQSRCVGHTAATRRSRHACANLRNLGVPTWLQSRPGHTKYKFIGLIH